MITSSLLLAFSALLLTSVMISLYFYLRKGKTESLSNEEDHRLVSVISSLPDGVVVLDNTFKPWLVNDSARSFLAITKEFPTFEDISVHFDQNLNLREKIREAMDSDKIVALPEIAIGGKTFEVFIAPVGKKEIIGASLLLQDISHEKELEKTKEEFSHVIVHELRAPVVAIKDSASLLISGGLPESDEKNMLNVIHEQALKLINQISSILDSAKVQDGKLVLKKGPSNLSAIIDDEMALFLPEAQRKNITLTAEVEKDLPVFSFDSVRITEAINNLISNSLKYTNENGAVTVSVKTDDRYKESRTTGNAIISVVDNGIGISDEKQHLLFQKFTDLDPNVGKEAKKISSGLGLYITKGIVNAHGGTITINSAEHKGTTVTFNLPIGQN